MFQAVVGAVAYIAAAYWLARLTTDDPADRLRYVLHYLAELYVMAAGLVMMAEFTLYRSGAYLDEYSAVLVGALEYAIMWGGVLAFPGAIFAFFAGNIMEEVRGRVKLPRIALHLPRRAPAAEGEEAREKAPPPQRQDSIIRIDNRRKKPKSLEV